MFLAWGSAVDTLNVRTDQSIFKVGIAGNKGMLYAVIAILILSMVVALVPPIQRIFDVVNISFAHWMILLVLTVMNIMSVEVMKLYLRMKDAKAAKN